MKQDLIDRDELFEDPDFPADSNIPNPFPDEATNKELVWRRPHDIIKESQLAPKFIVGSKVRFDVDQGSLGDCWFMAALATLATRPALLETVAPSNQSFEAGKYAGIFRFNFWRYGKWEQVIIDDRLPYTRFYYKGDLYEGLCYCHNRGEENEFWSALCEKAYAKFYGSYSALAGGWARDALVDMTGGVSETVWLKEQLTNLDRLWQRMMTSNDPESGLLLTAGITYNMPRGSKLPEDLYDGHAYSITATKEIYLQGTEKVRLLRVRNPWGEESEFQGKWSENSSNWYFVPKETKNSLNLTAADDGEFWVSFDEFITHFDSISLVYPTPDTLEPVLCDQNRRFFLDESKFEWHKEIYKGSWVEGVSDPFGFPFELSHPPNYDPNDGDADGENDEIPLIVTLLQMNLRRKGKDSEIEFLEKCASKGLTPDGLGWNLKIQGMDKEMEEKVEMVKRDAESRVLDVLIKEMKEKKTKLEFNKGELPIAFRIYKVTPERVKETNNEEDAFTLVARSAPVNWYKADREVAQTFFLAPGWYCVVPITYGYGDRDYLLRVMTSTFKNDKKK